MIPYSTITIVSHMQYILNQCLTKIITRSKKVFEIKIYMIKKF